MSIATATEAQREAIRSAAVALEHRSQHWAQNAATPNAAAVTSFQPIADATTAALAAAGYSGVTATQVILSSGVKVNAVAITGTGNFATPTIVNGAITGIVLSAS